jgi:hypothetical protein
MLSRLKMDCEYFINTAPHHKHLWAGNVPDQIAEMKRLYNTIDEKPEWITMKDIELYEKQMHIIINEQEQSMVNECEINLNMNR